MNISYSCLWGWVFRKRIWHYFGLFGIAFTSQAQPLWPQFRGPSGLGISETARPPVEFAKEEAVWVADLPPGHSSPCLWGDRIFLTDFTDGKLECRAFDRGSGKLLWTQPVEVKQVEQTHAFSNPAAPTPAAEAERVIFYFGSYGLVAYDHAGELAWRQPLPMQVSRGKYGSASSPLLCGDLVIQAVDTDEGGARLYAFKSSTGQKMWETPRPLFSSGWSTPILWQRDGKSQVILLGSKKLTAYDPLDGKEVWSIAGFPLETVPSPAADEHCIFACSAGLGGRSQPQFSGAGWIDLLQYDQNKDGKVQISEVPENYRFLLRPELPEGHPGRLFPFPMKGMLTGMDKDKDGAVTQQEWDKAIGEFAKMDSPVLMAVNPGSPDTQTENKVAWRVSKGIPEIPSPLCYHGKLYLVRDGGLVECLESNTGTVLYHERVGASGGYAASPVAANDCIYLASQSGTVTVLDARAATLNVLARNNLEEQITATPALAGDRIYIRTDKHLYAFGWR